MVDQKIFIIYCKICSRSIKRYWATLRTLWNGKKLPIIPPLLVNNELIIEMEGRANIFNKYLASSFNISSEVTFQLIKTLDPNKAHGHDKTSVKMLKLCAPSLCKPVTLLFENCLTFNRVWHKGLL